MTEILPPPNMELSEPPEAIGPAELEEALRHARAPIIKEGFAEPWTGDQSGLDPAQVGWEQAAQNLSAKIQEMQASGLVQLTPEGLTPKQAAENAGESDKLAEANKRAAELAEQLRQRQAAGAGQRPPVEAPSPSPREQWGGDSPPPADEEEPVIEPEEEEVEEQVKSEMSKFLGSVPWKRIALEGVTVIPPMVFGGLLGYLDPETARNVSVAAGSAGIGLAFTSMAAAMAERILPAHARAGLLGKALVAAKVGGLYAGNVLLSTAIGSHVGAAIRGGVETLQAAQQAGAGIGELPPHSDWAERQRAAGWPSAEQRFQAGGGAEELRAQGWQQLGGQPPAEQPPVETVVSNLPQVPVDAGEAQLEAAQAAQQAASAQEAARQAALQLGPTVAELAAQMPKQTVSEAIYQMIGDVPHRGEVTNILFRAIGDRVNSLNQGAIKAAAEVLRPVFDNIDKAVASSGVPYTEGGRAAVEALKGFNSPEAQAIRAGNLGDMEAAGNLFNSVLKQVLNP